MIIGFLSRLSSCLRRLSRRPSAADLASHILCDHFHNELFSLLLLLLSVSLRFVGLLVLNLDRFLHLFFDLGIAALVVHL